MKRILVVLALVAAGSVMSVTAAQAEVVQNEQVPFAQIVFVPCANGGAGELVLISGTLHILTSVTINDNNASIKSHFQPQGATGVGLTTGDKYNANGVTQETDTLSLQNGKAEFTFINNFRIVGQGPDNNLEVKQTIHQTVNANGDVTSTVDNTNIECR